MTMTRRISFGTAIATLRKMRAPRAKLNSVPTMRKKPIQVLCTVLACSALLAAQDSPDSVQLAKLYQLQAAFHRTMSIQDAENGDSPDVITQRIRDMLSLWTGDGTFVLAVNGPKDGNYIGMGDPSDDSTCPLPSANPQNRGTLCTFFKYVSAPFQPANRFVSLAPSYKTTFNIHGNMANGHFECHFFNVAPNPATGQPLWTATQHLGADVLASNVGGNWLFSYVRVSPTGIPVGSTAALTARLISADSNVIPAC